MVHTEFWNDPKVIEEMTPEDKYFFLYLLTNPNTTQTGIYQITKKQMAFDMGYSMETINSLLDRFLNHHEIITYNEETREIAIKNWGKYNLKRGGKPMIDCVVKELENVKDKGLIGYVGQNVSNENIKEIYDTYHDTCNDTYNDTSTIRGQYKEEDKEEYKEEDNKYIVEIVNYLNRITGKKYRTSTRKTRSLIKARMNEGFTVDDFKKVIDIKHNEWSLNPKMSKYLRPETLFGTKFESYLNQETKNDDPYDNIF